jgi:hypothetical protein
MVAVIAGCSSSTPNPGPRASDSHGTSTTTSGSTSTSPPSSSSPPSTTGSSAPADPRVAAAVKAYENFVAAYEVSQQHPPTAPNKPYVAGGDFTKYSFDPARIEYVGYILGLTQLQLAYRGTRPSPRVSVTNVNLAAKPNPTVTLIDCPTAPANWKIVATSPGPPPTTKTAPKAQPPYRAAVTVIFYEKRWGVQKITTDTSRTCTP